MGKLQVSERRACQVIGQPRATQRRPPVVREGEETLTHAIVALASQYGRYGYRVPTPMPYIGMGPYRRITALLRADGWVVNPKRVERIWRREGLKVPKQQPKRRRLWLNEGSCIRLRPLFANHVWSYDFVEDRTHDGRKFRMLTLIDEFSRETLAITVKRRLNSHDVLETLADVMLTRGTPAYIRSDNGPELAAKAVTGWLATLGVGTLFIEPGSPWENGYCESFNSKLRDECLNGEIFSTLQEAQVVIEQWRRHYNRVRPHSSLGYRPPTPGAALHGKPVPSLS